MLSIQPLANFNTVQISSYHLNYDPCVLILYLLSTHLEFPVKIKIFFGTSSKMLYHSILMNSIFINFLFTALTETGIRDLFNVVVGNEDYENAKPSPDAFLTAANQLGVLPQFCCAFEDS